MWGSRQNYTKLWWKPPPGGAQRRGFVWLDRSFPATAPNSSSTTNDTFLPLVKISSDASRFPYRVKGGNPSAVRISRIISETFRLGLKDVRWFVMGDDDTIFFPENLATVLQKYDHGKFYYIGQSTESQQQAILHSFGMAYGGGGIALSYPLAEAMANMQDDCLQRYPNIYGSDGRIAACAAELGVPLTREPGFHQIDLNKNIRGILAAHPVAPLVSLHHLDRIQPIFPDRDRLQALQHLYDGALPDQEGLLQQSICFDTHRGLTFSVSWGYVVQVFDGILTTLEVQKPIATFQDWVKARQGRNIEGFTMDVRANPTDPCQNPAVFFMESVGYTAGAVHGVYRRKTGPEPSECPPLIEQDTVEVFKQPQSKSWITAPQRQCCEVVEKKLLFLKAHPYLIDVRDCMRNEVIAPHN